MTWIQDPIPGMEGYAEPKAWLQCPPTGGEGLRGILEVERLHRRRILAMLTREAIESGPYGELSPPTR